MQGDHIGFGQGFPQGNMRMDQVHVFGDLTGQGKLRIQDKDLCKVAYRSLPHQEGDAVPHLDQLFSKVPDIPAGSAIFRSWNFTAVDDQDMQCFHMLLFLNT